MIRRLKSEILKSLPPKTRRRVLVEIEDEGIRKKMFDDFREFLTRSGQAASLCRKKSSRLMEISKSLSEASPYERGADSNAQGEMYSTRELAEQRLLFFFLSKSFQMFPLTPMYRKSLLMQLFKNTGTAKLPVRTFAFFLFQFNF